MQPDVNLWYFKLKKLEISKVTTLGCKDIGIRKSKFVAKTQFLHKSFIEIIIN